MILPRMNMLLAKAAENLSDGQGIDGNFLRENNVTLDEAMGLTKQLAAIISGYLRAPMAARTALLLTGVNEGEIPDSMIWANAAREITSGELNSFLKKLKDVRT